jgi:hypothetical protein
MLHLRAALRGGVYRCVRGVHVFVKDEEGAELGSTTVEAGTLLLVEGRASQGFRRLTLDVDGGLPARDLALAITEEALAACCRFTCER